MSESKAFDHLCDALQEQTELDRLAARGTVRIALKGAGLDPRNVTGVQLAVVAKELLPTELGKRGIDGAKAFCAEMRLALAALADDGPALDTPDAVFARLAG